MKTNPQITRIKWFIKFFKSKPKNRWCQFAYRNEKGQCCAAGFLGETDNKTTIKSMEIRHILFEGITWINNGYNERYQQPHPKARILQALRDKLKEAQHDK